MTNNTDFVDSRQLLEWCKIPADKLSNHPGLRIPYREVRDSEEMGQLMAEELADVIEKNNEKGLPIRAIIPCGPKCWYTPFANLVNTRSLSLRNLAVFHMDECLDWQGQLLSAKHPYNFRSFHGKALLRRHTTRACCSKRASVLAHTSDDGDRENRD